MSRPQRQAELAGGSASTFRRIGETLRPDPRQTVAEWADAHRILPPVGSAKPGPWRTSRVPYMRAVMEACSPSAAYELVAVQASAQCGKSEVLLNIIGYTMDQAPAPILAIQPTVDLAERFSRQRIAPMIAATPRLKRVVAPSRSRDSGNTLLSKEFINGILVMAGANSGAGLRSMPAKIVLADEVDAYPGDVDGEGDPIELARARTETYVQSKMILTSTPKTKGLSRIELAVAQCERQAEFRVPCPHCKHAQALVFEQLRWPEGAPELATYECVACGAQIEHRHKPWMVRAGTWVLIRDEGTRSIGFTINQLVSTLGKTTWGGIAEKYEQAKGKPALLRTFYNTVLGLPFAEASEAPAWRALYDRRETYPIGIVPPGVRFLTAGVDVQKDRLECFDEETEVLTADGWRRFANLVPSDSLATVDLAADRLEFQRPTALIRRPHSGDMVRIRSATTDVLVTPNHRMVVYKGVYPERQRPQITLARELKASHRLKAWVEHWEGEAIESIAIPETRMDLTRPIGRTGMPNVDLHRGRYRGRANVGGVRHEAMFATATEAVDWVRTTHPDLRLVRPGLAVPAAPFAEFVGLFLSEGHLSASTGYPIAISQNAGPKADRIRAILRQLPWKFREHRVKGRRVIMFTITAKALWHWLAEHCGKGSHHKRIPAFLRTAPRSVIDRLLAGLYLGDGWMQQRTGRKPVAGYATASKQLADDLQELLLRMGFRSNIHRRPPQRTGWAAMFYVSCLSSCVAGLKTKRAGRMRPNFSSERYDGIVYCATVPNGTLVCRRNGKMFVAGNCQVIGWGRGKESWSVDYRVLPGDTARPEVWAVLDALLAEDIPCTGGGTLPIRLLCIDSGYATQSVYSWVRQYPQAAWGPAGVAARAPRTVVATKGVEDWRAVLLPPAKVDTSSDRRGLKIARIGTSLVKRELYDWLRLEGPTDAERAGGLTYPPGFVHFPEYGEEWFKQLTAERLVTTATKQGFRRERWEKDPGARNEVLDTWILARAAAAIVGLDQATEKDWKRLEAVVPAGLLPDPAAAIAARDPAPAPLETTLEGDPMGRVPPEEPTTPRPGGKRPRVTRSAWVGRFRG